MSRSFSTNSSKARSSVSSGVSGCTIAPHEVFGQDERLQRRGLRGKVDLVQIDHAQEPIVAIHHGQNRVRGPAESVDDRGERIVGMQASDVLGWARGTGSPVPGPRPVARSFLDGLARGSGFPLAKNRWIACRKG